MNQVLLALMVLWLGLLGPGKALGQEPGAAATQVKRDHIGEEPMTLQLQVRGRTFEVQLEQNQAAQELAAMVEGGPVTVSMRDYGGFEKVGDLVLSLSAQDRPMTAQPGDVMLYQRRQMVIFYGSNNWSYTPLGRVVDLTGWGEALGKGDVTVTLSRGD